MKLPSERTDFAHLGAQALFVIAGLGASVFALVDRDGVRWVAWSMCVLALFMAAGCEWRPHEVRIQKERSSSETAGERPNVVESFKFFALHKFWTLSRLGALPTMSKGAVAVSVPVFVSALVVGILGQAPRFEVFSWIWIDFVYFGALIWSWKNANR